MELKRKVVRQTHAAKEISAFADAGGGVAATSAAHGLSIGDTITISGTTNYNGTFTVTAVDDANTFDFNDTYVADDGVGMWMQLLSSTDLSEDIHWFAAAAFVGFSFFTLSTHMHENHLYPVLPLLILLAGRNLQWAAVAAVAGLAIFVNMGVHDLLIGDALLAGVGGTTEIPARAVAWYQNQGGGLSREPYLSRLEVGLAYANAVVVVACYVGLMTLTFGEIEARRRSRSSR